MTGLCVPDSTPQPLVAGAYVAMFNVCHAPRRCSSLAASLLLPPCPHTAQVTFTFENAALRAGTTLWLCQTVFATATVAAAAASGSETAAPALGQVTDTAGTASEVMILWPSNISAAGLALPPMTTFSGNWCALLSCCRGGRRASKGFWRSPSG